MGWWFFHALVVQLQIDGGVHAVHILLVQLLPKLFNGLAETLEMDNLPLPQEPDHIVDVRIVGKPQDIIIGHPGFLLWERIA